MRDFLDDSVIVRWFLNLIMVVVLLVGGVYIHGEATQAEEALCVLRADYERRRDTTWEFLYDVRTGKRKPIRGITDGDLVRAVEGLRSNVKALSDLDC